jgi:hypothetical protein
MTNDHRAAATFLRGVLLAKGTSIISTEVLYLGADGGEVYKDRQDYWADRIRYLDRLRDMTAGSRRTVLLIFRRPDEFAESLYNTAVQQGVASASFTVFRERIAPLVDYERQLDLFRDRFESVLPLSFADLRPQLTDKVFSALGIPSPPIKPKDQNVSADPRVVVWFALKNEKGLTRAERAELRAFLTSAACNSIFSDPASLWEGEVARTDYCKVPGRAPVKFDMRMTPAKHIASLADVEVARIENAFTVWRRTGRSG